MIINLKFIIKVGEKHMNKKYMIIGLATSIIVLALGVSLAYWVPRIVGEGAGITLKAANLRIVFTDTDAISASNIEPGWSYTKTFSVRSESDTTYTYDLIIKNLVNTFVTEGFLQYKITSTNGYNMTEYKDIPKCETTSDKVIGSNIQIEPGETQNYTIEFIYKETEEDQSPDMGKTFGGSIFIKEHEPQFPKGSLGEKLLSDNQTILTRTNFDSIFTEDNTGTLYKASGNETEDESEVYYFAGNAQNNWVKFGKNQNDADLYWRIIRTNEDGSVRLLYIGPDKATTSAFITTGKAYNSSNANTNSVGYMYGSTGSLDNNRMNTTDSEIKKIIDDWYSKTLIVKIDERENTYDTYVSKTAIYCNDRSTDLYSNSDNMQYVGYKRLYTFKAPSYKCGNDANRSLHSTANVADKFSVSTTKGGNGKLTYGVALMTADELVYAGARWESVSKSWFINNSQNATAVGSKYWSTMTPAYYTSTNTRIFAVRGENYPGYLTHLGPNYTSAIGVRPVLSLKSCVKYVSGDGSSDNPYEVEINSTCANLEN